MKRTITITAATIFATGMLVAGSLFASANCGSVLGCHGTDPELTRLIR
jgi:hypothetical protein